MTDPRKSTSAEKNIPAVGTEYVTVEGEGDCDWCKKDVIGILTRFMGYGDACEDCRKSFTDATDSTSPDQDEMGRLSENLFTYFAQLINDLKEERLLILSLKAADIRDGFRTLESNVKRLGDVVMYLKEENVKLRSQFEKLKALEKENEELKREEGDMTDTYLEEAYLKKLKAYEEDWKVMKEVLEDMNHIDRQGCIECDKRRKEVLSSLKCK